MNAFTSKTATVKHFHVNITNFIDPETQQEVTGEVVVLELSNGDTLFSPIGAISRAMSAMLDKKDLFLLRKASVEYVESERTIGAKFQWRPSDSREFTATTAGTFRSIEAIEPADANWSALNALPAYETVQDKRGDYKAPEQELEETLPEGAKKAKK